jgi:ABC-2 type transport system permease protein
MHPTIYMLEKELIEHKLVTRVPLFFLLLGFILSISLLVNGDLQSNMMFDIEFSDLSASDSSEFLSSFSLGIASSAWMISVILSILYLPKTFRKERQEGSAMFWRSMPVSYAHTHAVKLAFGLLVIPLICSVLVFFAHLSLWLINIATDNQLAPLIGQGSLLGVLTEWVKFLGQISLAAIAWLPLACIALMVSQLVSSPILVMLLVGYSVKWLSSYLLGFDGVSEFFALVFSMPSLVFSSSPLSGFANAGALNLIIYYGLGILSLAASLSLSKTNEVSLSAFIPSVWSKKKDR